MYLIIDKGKETKRKTDKTERKIEDWTVFIKDFNPPLSGIDRKSSKKEISKNIKDK